MMQRREFVAGMGAVMAAPLAARAQQAGKIYRIGFLTGATLPDLSGALRVGLRELGWKEGDQFVLEERSAEGAFAKIPELAADLVKRNVDVIVISATAIAYVGKSTANIPVVFAIGEDPVSAGYASTLSRPGGRMTGLTSLNIDLDGKRLEILKTALPSVRQVGVLSSRHDRAHDDRVATTEQSAGSLGIQLQILEASNPDLISSAFDAAGHARVAAVMVLGVGLLRSYQREIVAAATKARLPVISAWRELPDAGGLMSYGTNVPAMFKRAATFVDRILKGMNPGDLPVEQATKFELVINVRTARSLGITMPASLLLRADQVIE
jgi:putative ABC transport system substrate-binding protein